MLVCPHYFYQCPCNSFHKITVVFLSGIAKLAFNKNYENAGYNSDFFKIIHQTGWSQWKIEPDISTVVGPSSTMVIELSNICVVFVFECGRPSLQISTLPLSVRPSSGGRPWVELSKSINLFLWNQFSTEYAKQNANQLLSKSAKLTFTGAIEKAEWRDWKNCINYK